MTPQATDYSRRTGVILLTSVFVAAIVARVLVFDALTHDTTTFVLAWFQGLAEGGFRALGQLIPNIHGETGGNYSPPYYYLLYLGTLFRGVLPDLYIIKLVSTAFDVVAAYFGYRIVEFCTGSRKKAWIGASLILMAPTVVANSAWWGQSDMVWVSLLLGALYSFLAGRAWAGIIFFSVAFATKAQAVFFSPYLLMLLLQGRVSIRHLAAIPLLVGVVFLPAILLGRGFEEVFTTYLRQGGYFQMLSLNAPNLYYFVPDSAYVPMLIAGAALTFATMALLSAMPALKRLDQDMSRNLLAATVFVTLAPYLLPKMHDRYFLAGDVLSLLLAVINPKFLVVPILMQIASMLSYVPIISWSVAGEMDTSYMMTAVLACTMAVTILVWSYARAMRTGDPRSWTPGGLLVGGYATALIASTWVGLSILWTMVGGRNCPLGGWVQRFFCDHPFQVDLLQGTKMHWILFLLIGAASVWVSAFIFSWSGQRLNQRP